MLLVMGHFIMTPAKLLLVRELLKEPKTRRVLEEIGPSVWLTLSDTNEEPVIYRLCGCRKQSRQKELVTSETSV